MHLILTKIFQYQTKCPTVNHFKKIQHLKKKIQHNINNWKENTKAEYNSLTHWKYAQKQVKGSPAT